METLYELQERLNKLNNEFSTLLKLSAYESYEDLSGLTIDYAEPDQLLLLDELRGVMGKIKDINYDLKYLQNPIVYTGNLSKNSRGRYELPNGREFTSGTMIECLINDGFHEHLNAVTDEYESSPYWVISSIEHDGTDYYLVYNKKILLEGLLVRVRK